MEQDCICALATAAGSGALGVVRISGRGTKEIVSMVFRPKRTASGMRDRQVCYGEITADGECLDEVLLWTFSAPHSYTGEDMAEISCHGSTYILQRLLELLVQHGCRMAAPGEFTRRAFMNGKMDLSQAEAVADLIASDSKASHQLAFSQMRGGYAQELRSMRAEFIRLVSLLELELDFSEEDVEFADRKQLKELIATLSGKTEQLIRTFRMGNALKKGIPVAIVGRPNAGKSTLLNTLLSDDRAIVSPIPGTTRDTIEECMSINGITFRFIDTAGLRESGDAVEAMGIERSRKAIDSAEIVLHLADLQETAEETAAACRNYERKGKKCLVLHNKEDLAETPRYGKVSANPDIYRISALKGEGLEELKRALAGIAGFESKSGEVMITNVRHYEALQHVHSALQQLAQGLESGRTPDLLSIDARNAIRHLGEITGEVTNNAILGEIFSHFCIGK